MELTPYFSRDLVLLDVEAPDKWALIEIMMNALMTNPDLKSHPGITRDQLCAAVLQREKDKATGLGDGFAFPHARIPNLNATGLCLALPKTPLDFGAPDGRAADIVCLLVVPEEQPQIALQIMSQFARLVANPLDREILTSLRKPKALCDFIKRRVLGVETTVTARDIMREPLADIHPDTPLQEVTRIMLKHHLDTIAVVEEDGTILGEITCENLFKLGMPDFFSQLKSISFIREYDPFEKYFKGEGDTLARDVMTQDYATVPDDATLLEVVFELAVKRHTKVHVVRDGKRIGAIDRILVLDRVITI